MKRISLLVVGLLAASPLAHARGHAERAHSHNDYEQHRPLEDALSYNFSSVEADVWLRNGDLRVGHMPWDDEGGIRELYLDPLQRRVDQTGSVYGDGKPFTLWIDIKSTNFLVPSVIRRILNSYPMLTTFTDYAIEEGPVTVVLTGNASNKREVLDDVPVRKACRDDDSISPQDPSADLRWLWYGLSWSKHFSWNGTQEMPAAQREKFHAIVRSAHEKGRKIRFWHTPETDGYWTEALDAGVDLISSDHLPELARFLAEH